MLYIKCSWIFQLYYGNCDPIFGSYSAIIKAARRSCFGITKCSYKNSKRVFWSFLASSGYLFFSIPKYSFVNENTAKNFVHENIF